MLAVGIWPGWLGHAAAFPDPVAQAGEHLVGAVYLVAYVGEVGADEAEVGSAGDREGAAGPGDVAIVGDEDAVAAQILALSDAGVTDFVATEFARGQGRERTRSLLKAVIAAS